jgi:transcriptional regulator with XRE-family HTH domain
MKAKTLKILTGEALRELRLSKGISVRKAAAMAGVNPSTIQRVEGGDNSPSLETILKIQSAIKRAKTPEIPPE